MHPLTASEVLQVWERGQGLHPVDRALILLAAAQPGIPWEQLARLPIGQRDAWLLALRELTFGSRLASYAECPHCGEKLEFDCSELNRKYTGNLTLSDSPAAQEAQIAGYAVQYRLPDSFDLAALAQCSSPEEARRVLLERCVIQAVRPAGAAEGSPVHSLNAGAQNTSAAVLPVTAGDLPGELVEQVAEHIVQSDPGADIALDLSCPACDHRWQITFDIVTFFWTEINSLAQRLLRQVHTLAQSYGWREADILAMSAARRQAYLEMVL